MTDRVDLKIKTERVSFWFQKLTHPDEFLIEINLKVKRDQVRAIIEAMESVLEDA